MADQYVATDKDSGLEVAITGTFPPVPEDRIHLARTANLFTKLLAAGLATSNDSERRELFTHLEAQLELAAALVKQDFAEVTRLMQEMLARIGLTPERMQEMAKEFGEQMTPERIAEMTKEFGEQMKRQPGDEPGDLPPGDSGPFSPN